MENKTKNHLKEIFLISNESELSKAKEILDSEKNLFNDSPNNLIRKAIIDYFLIINPLSQKWKEKEITNISNYLMEKYCEDKIEKLIQKGFYLIENCILKYLISLDEVFPKEKVPIKLCFQIILLSQNKEMLIKYIKSFSDVDIKDIEKEIFNLNYDNPFSINFIHVLLKFLFNGKQKKDNLNIFDYINNTIKDIQIFRCNQCFDLLYVSHDINGTTLTCNNSLHTIKNSKSLKTLKNYDNKCSECKDIIRIYCDNYKCLKFKKFF